VEYVHEKPEETISERLEELMEYLRQAQKEKAEAEDAIREEDAKVQDFLHLIEFAPDAKARNKIAKQLQESRRHRRECKDRMQELEFLVNFVQDPKNKPVINNLKALLGNQKKREEYLYGERHYTLRVLEEEEAY
jgi:uncharacterized protein YeeX (DUF496 family)